MDRFLKIIGSTLLASVLLMGCANNDDDNDPAPPDNDVTDRNDNNNGTDNNDANDDKTGANMSSLSYVYFFEDLPTLFFFVLISSLKASNSSLPLSPLSKRRPNNCSA